MSKRSYGAKQEQPREIKVKAATWGAPDWEANRDKDVKRRIEEETGGLYSFRWSGK